MTAFVVRSKLSSFWQWYTFALIYFDFFLIFLVQGRAPGRAPGHPHVGKEYTKKNDGSKHNQHGSTSQITGGHTHAVETKRPWFDIAMSSRASNIVHTITNRRSRCRGIHTSIVGPRAVVRWPNVHCSALSVLVVFGRHARGEIRGSVATSIKQRSGGGVTGRQLLGQYGSIGVSQVLVISSMPPPQHPEIFKYLSLFFLKKNKYYVPKISLLYAASKHHARPQ